IAALRARPDRSQGPTHGTAVSPRIEPENPRVGSATASPGRQTPPLPDVGGYGNRATATTTPQPAAGSDTTIPDTAIPSRTDLRIYGNERSESPSRHRRLEASPTPARQTTGTIPCIPNTSFPRISIFPACRSRRRPAPVLRNQRRGNTAPARFG